jgi:hypothetical protein
VSTRCPERTVRLAWRVMRRAVPAAAALLAGPTVLAFWSGGYFTQPRLIAGIVAWALVFALAVAGPVPLPRTLPGRLAVGGLVLITAWSALSITWAPLRGPAVESVERLLLYLAAVLVAIGVFRIPRLQRAVEPALAAGSLIVIGYGLTGRLAPGLITLARSKSSGGQRLEQPITYWNSEGALAGMGLVLCAHLAADRSRPLAVRCLAAAATAPLGAGVYLSYSRGAIAVAVVGLAILVALTRSRGQLEAAAVALVAGAGAALAASLLPGVASLSGSLGARERDGAVMAVVLVALAAGAAALTAWRASARGTMPARDVLGGARRFTTVAIVALAAIGLVIGGLQERRGANENGGANATRLTSAYSNRYDYWQVGVREFRRHPLEGAGAASFRVAWLRERPIRESVLEVHSLPIEMAAELGIVGLLGLVLMVTGVALAASRALRSRGAIAAGWCAALLVWLLQASIDWHWQIPAVTLPALILAGALIARSEAPPEAAVVDRARARARARAGDGTPAAADPAERRAAVPAS